MKTANFYFAAGIFWFLFVTFLLSLPGTEFPKVTWMTKIWLDKWVHVFLFFILVVIWSLAYKDKYVSGRIQKVFMWIALTALIYGIIMEMIQHFFVPYRGFETGDVLADALGSVGGLYYATKRLTKKSAPIAGN